MAKLNEEELKSIREILSPLNRNPVITESLIPMAKSLRRIKGEPEPKIPDDDSEVTTKEPHVGQDGGGIEFDDIRMNQEEEGPPPIKPIEDFDDSDLDEL